MDAIMAIKDFNTFLATSNEDGALLKALRKLAAAKPEDVRQLAKDGAMSGWGVWY
jgi:hypothetical protein